MKKIAIDREQPVGLIGLGLMGQGIAACLLAHGFKVVAYNRTAERAEASVGHVDAALSEMLRRKIVSREAVRSWRSRYRLASSLSELSECFFVVETVKEDLELKRSIFAQIEQVVSSSAVIASNTSSIPISVIQEGRKQPGRFVGMHWGEPAQIMRYLEVIPGKHTSPRTLRVTQALGVCCDKKPTVLKQDIRGFISNRLMYAMIREAFHLVEAGVADIETVDRSFRNDIGWWATLAGPFRWMDLTGIPAYAAVMQDLLPKLSIETSVPALMEEKVKQGALGISNRKGFYRYTPAEARKWEKVWVEFTYDVRKLVEQLEEQVDM